MKVKRISRVVCSVLMAFCICGTYDAVAEFHPGPMIIGRIAAKKLKEMKSKDDFSGADANKDGKLDKHEATKAKETHGLDLDDETFKKIDKNGDGVLSHDECEQYHKECEEAAAKEKEAGKESADEAKKDTDKSSATSQSKSSSSSKPKRLRPLQKLLNPSQGE